MWVVKNNSFVSIVQDRNDASMVFIRGRRESDVRNFIGSFASFVDVVETPENDYQFRVHVSKVVLADMMLAATYEVDYPNFKDSIKNDHALSCFSHEVWLSGYRNLDQREITVE